MRLRTAGAGLVTLVILAGGYQVAQTVSRERTSATMPKAKTPPANKDGRVYAVIQVCWEPTDTRVAAQITIGPLNRGETGMVAPSCATPWTRKGLVRPGDRLVLAWTIEAPVPARVIRWRFTVSGVERMGGNDQRQQAIYACTVGVLPC